MNGTTAVPLWRKANKKEGEWMRQDAEWKRKTVQEGLIAYRKRQWKKGLSKFKECKKAAPEDPVYQVYLERCENFITQSPPKNWNGVYEFQEK